MLNIIEPQLFKSNSVEGSVDEPKVLHLETSTAADETGLNDESIQVYPNPAESEFYIRVVSNEEDEVQYTLRDLAGKEILQTKKAIGAGLHNLVQVIDPNWKAGPYILTCTTSAQVYSTILFILKP